MAFTKLKDVYVDILKSRAESLKKLSNHLVADAWFSKRPFTDQVSDMGLHLVSRRRDEANLRYLYSDEGKKKRGRPKLYDGKINSKEIDSQYFNEIAKTNDSHIHAAIVYSVALKRKILLVHVKYKKTKGKQIGKLYFSTDLELKPMALLDMYSTRFQIEFLYRDAKQYTGLNHCQARSEDKLNFHFNMSLSAINIAKVKHWITQDKETRKPFSMADMKTLNNNKLMLDTLLSEFAINTDSKINKEKIQKLLRWGVKAA